MPLDILPDDELHVSISQIKTWQRCPKQYEYRYVRGAEPELVPRALAFGAAFHTALAAHYLAKRDSKVMGPADLLAAFDDAWRAHADGGVPMEATAGDVDEHDLARRMFMVLASSDVADRAKVVDVERPVTATLYDPNTGEVLEERLHGVVDLILDEDGRRVVVEHKTSSRRYGEEQLRFDHQMAAYQVALEQAKADGARRTADESASRAATVVDQLRRYQRELLQIAGAAEAAAVSTANSSPPPSPGGVDAALLPDSLGIAFGEAGDGLANKLAAIETNPPPTTFSKPCGSGGNYNAGKVSVRVFNGKVVQKTVKGWAPLGADEGAVQRWRSAVEAALGGKLKQRADPPGTEYYVVDGAGVRRGFTVAYDADGLNGAPGWGVLYVDQSLPAEVNAMSACMR